MVGKLFAKIIQRRMQVVVEDVVVNAQCGFRSGRGCTDGFLCTSIGREGHRTQHQGFPSFVDLYPDLLCG